MWQVLVVVVPFALAAALLVADQIAARRHLSWLRTQMAGRRWRVEMWLPAKLILADGSTELGAVKLEGREISGWRDEAGNVGPLNLPAGATVEIALPPELQSRQPGQ